MLTDEEIQRHLDDNPDDDTPLIQRLRAELKDANKRAARVPDLEARLAEKDFGSVLSDAKLADLNDDQRSVLFDRLAEDDRTAEKARALAERLGWAEPEHDSPITPDEQAVIDRQAATTDGAQPPISTGVIKPEDAAAWPVDKTIKFIQAHPDAFEQLKRGESVTGIVF